MNLPVLVGGVGLAYLFGSPNMLRRAGVPVPAFVTHAQSTAIAGLPAVAGVTYSSTRPNEFTERWNDIKRQLIALRGFKVQGGRSYVQFTAADYESIFAAFLASVRAGVREGGYRITSERMAGFDISGEAALDKVLAHLPGNMIAVPFVGEIAEPLPFSVTALGAAVLAAELERRRVSWLLALTLADHVRADEAIYRLCLEMDESGYLIAGKPAPDPRIADGVSYAAGVTVRTMAGGVASLAGSGAGLVAGALLGSPIVWAAALGFAAWKVAG